MATGVSGYTDEERAALYDCRRRGAAAGFKWGITSLIPLWGAVRFGFLPRIMAVPTYTVSFVLFSFLGATSTNDSCIENILSLEDSELANKLRKRLPKQAGRFDARRDGKETPTTTEGGRGGGEKTQVSQTGNVNQQREEGEKRMNSSNDPPAGESRSDNSKRPIRTNKYGDPVFEED